MVNCCSRSSTVWVLVEHVNTVKINIPTLNVEQKRAILLLALFRVECRYQLDDVFLFHFLFYVKTLPARPIRPSAAINQFKFNPHKNILLFYWIVYCSNFPWNDLTSKWSQWTNLNWRGTVDYKDVERRKWQLLRADEFYIEPMLIFVNEQMQELSNTL